MEKTALDFFCNYLFFLLVFIFNKLKLANMKIKYYDKHYNNLFIMLHFFLNTLREKELLFQHYINMHTHQYMRNLI